MDKFPGHRRVSTWTTALLLLSAVAAGCSGDGGRDPILGPGDNVYSPPTVTVVAPLDAATDASITTPVVSATFSEAVSPLTGAATFTVTCEAPCVNPAGDVALDATGTRAEFTVDPDTVLVPLTEYTATVTSARSLASGLAMAAPYTWTFTTGVVPDTLRPTVAFTAPPTTLPGPTLLVATNTSIVATFSESMAPATIGATSFTLTCESPCTLPEGAVSYVTTSMAAVFTPDDVLEPDTVYTATITTAATDLAGNTLSGNQDVLLAESDYVWTFMTGATSDTTRPSVSVTAPVTTDPGPTTGAAVNTAITASFTEDMSPATLNATSFTVTCVLPCVSPAGAVSYQVSGRTAVFTPAAQLAADTTYTATITSDATDLAGNDLGGNQDDPPAASDYVWTFTTAATPDTTRPAVTLTAPLTTSPGPTPGAPFNTTVSAYFSEDMAPGTLNSTSFTLTCALPCVSPAGAVSYVGSTDTAVFTPAAPLTASTTYTATVTIAATDLAGNALGGNQAALPAASSYVWTFTTAASADSTRPAVTVTSPLTTTPGPTTGAPTNRAIAASFSENMAPGTMTAANFTVTCGGSCVSPAGSVNYSVGTRTLIFTPSAGLAASTTYTATVSTGATDLAGNALGGNQALAPAASSYVWTFTTGATADTTRPTVLSTNPADGAIGVCVNKSINATFSEPMDPVSITVATFTLSVTAGAPVTGAVTYDPQTHIATLKPAVNLTAATGYTATIAGGVSGVNDLADNALADDKVITFTTNASTCATAAALGAAAPFGSFGGNATLTNDGLNTVINGDVGANTASSSITGFRDSGGNVYTITTDNNGLVNGLVYTQTDPPGSVAGDAVTQARVDALLAFNSLSPASLPGGIDVSSLAQCPSCGGAGGGPDELAGRTLPPGIYMSTTGTYDIGGLARTVANLTLDAGGDADAVWVFQSAAGIGTLNVGLTGPATPAVPIKVLLINGAQSKNVFWYAPAGATIGTGSTMEGTILADASITFSTAGGSPPTAVVTTFNGRAIALTAGVTLTNTVVNVPAP